MKILSNRKLSDIRGDAWDSGYETGFSRGRLGGIELEKTKYRADPFILGEIRKEKKEEGIMNVYTDLEFTGLHKDTTLISLGMVSSSGKELYCELTDYDHTQVGDWIQKNVISHLQYTDKEEREFKVTLGNYTAAKGDSVFIEGVVKEWLGQFEKVELYSDVPHYDIVLIHDLFGHAFNMPDHVYYIPFDIASIMKAYGVDPDIDREAFIDRPIEGTKHSAIYDAKVVQACHEKLMKNKKQYLGRMV